MVAAACRSGFQPVCGERPGFLFQFGQLQEVPFCHDRSEAGYVDETSPAGIFDHHQFGDDIPISSARAADPGIQSSVAGIQFVFLHFNSGGCFRSPGLQAVVPAVSFRHRFQKRPDGFQDFPSVPVDVRHHHGAITQSFGFDPLLDNIQSGLFGAADQNAFSTTQTVGDDIDQ